MASGWQWSFPSAVSQHPFSALTLALYWQPGTCSLDTHLFIGFEYVALEHVAGAISRDVAEDLEVLRVVRHVEYPEENKGQASAVLPDCLHATYNNTRDFSVGYLHDRHQNTSHRTSQTSFYTHKKTQRNIPNIKNQKLHFPLKIYSSVLNIQGWSVKMGLTL
jgi:hypothetical protein